MSDSKLTQIWVSGRFGMLASVKGPLSEYTYKNRLLKALSDRANELLFGRIPLYRYSKQG